MHSEWERGYTNDDIESKSTEFQAFKMFSEGRSPVEVAILLDLAADHVLALYRDYWELTGSYKLVQFYDEARYDLRGLLKPLSPGVHKIMFKGPPGVEHIDYSFEHAPFKFEDRAERRSYGWPGSYYPI